MSLPPLNALRAFEAAARTGTFVAAGQALGVSSAAISQQVRQLEAFWGRKLFIRQGNRLTLTDAGLMSYPEIGAAMSGLSQISRVMQRAPRQSRLVLSAPLSVAETWLPACLARWPAARPLQMRVEDDPVEFARDGIHLRIFFGHRLYTDYRIETLFHDHFMPVCAPALIETYGSDVKDVPDSRLIHTDWGADFASGPDFTRLRPVDPGCGVRVPSSSLALRLALAGYGAALVPNQMARAALGAGTLQALSAPPLPMSQPYAVAFPNAIADRPAVREMLEILKDSGAPAQ